jgi:hypothetical protein
MAQATSGYATSGNQYNSTNSYFLIDSVPGSGDSIPGPVTISATVPAVALTVAGNEIVTGALGVSGFFTASSGVYTTGVQPITAPGTLVIGNAVCTTSVVGGEVFVESQAGDIVMTAAAKVQIEGDSIVPTVASVSLGNSGGAVLKVLNVTDATTTNYGLQVLKPAYLVNGLANFPSMGTYAATAAATLASPGAYTFNMTGNKAFVSTGACFTLIVNLPLNALGLTNNWTAMITQVGATATNVTSVIQSGTQLILQNAAITTPITVAITLF